MYFWVFLYRIILANKLNRDFAQGTMKARTAQSVNKHINMWFHRKKERKNEKKITFIYWQIVNFIVLVDVAYWWKYHIHHESVLNCNVQTIVLIIWISLFLYGLACWETYITLNLPANEGQSYSNQTKIYFSIMIANSFLIDRANCNKNPPFP